MSMYVNIGGGAKQLTSLYFNKNGSNKALTNAYANINGVSKQIFGKMYKYIKYKLITDGIKRYYFTHIDVNNEPISYYLDSNTLYTFFKGGQNNTSDICPLDYRIVSNRTPKYFTIDDTDHSDLCGHSLLSMMSGWRQDYGSILMSNATSNVPSTYAGWHFWKTCSSYTDKIIFDSSYTTTSSNTKIYRIAYLPSASYYVIDKYLIYNTNNEDRSWYKWEYEYVSEEISDNPNKYSPSQLISSGITGNFWFDYNTSTYNSSIMDEPEIGYVKQTI